MTIKSNYFLLCENFIIDTRQRASIINVYDTNWAASYPMKYPVLRYAASLNIKNAGDTDTITLSLVIKSQDDKEVFRLAEQALTITPKVKIQNVGVVFDVQDVTFPEAGRYEATILVDGEIVATNLLDMKTELPPED